MIKPNWDVFNAKFSGSHEETFEWFSYILFCIEFKHEKGIFRFKNQSGMETDPIKVGDDFIGFEAKYYTTNDKLSNNINELKKKIDISKSKNSELTKLYFYLPIDWSESSKKNTRKTKQQNEIEDYAKSKGIDIVWKTASFFESPFVCIENELISKHFFLFEKSSFDVINKQIQHTENILFEIKTKILFNNNEFELNRESEIEKIINNQYNVCVLSGIGGVGKTAIIKSIYNKLKNEIPFVIFKSTEFDLSNIDFLFKDYSISDFIDSYSIIKEKIIVIDSAEKLIDLKNHDPFKEFLLILIKNNWKIIFTTRENYLEDLNYELIDIYNISPINIRLETLSIDELTHLSEAHSFKLPKDDKLLNLIKIPFYLNEYLKHFSSNVDYKKFKDNLWKNSILKNNPSRAECFQKLAFRRAETGNFYINNPEFESVVLNGLKEDGFLGYEDEKGYFITHDIYEEWALEKLININFINKNTNESFFTNIGYSLAIRRSFRNWISEKLLLEDNEIKTFIEEVINDSLIDKIWKDEIIISILLSDYSDYFFTNFKNKLLGNNLELLKSFSFWLRISCKEIDENFAKLMGLEKIDLGSVTYILTKPKGNGWKSLIKFIFDNIKDIDIKNIGIFIPILNDWNSKFKSGETTKYASSIALKYYEYLITNDFHFYRNDGFKDKLIQTIINGSSEIKNELKKIIEEIIKNKWKNNGNPYFDLSKTTLTKMDGFYISQIIPEDILKLADLFWSLDKDEQEEDFNHSSIHIESNFGIKPSYSEYYPASAFQTPIYSLLLSSLQSTIDFIINFTNKSINFHKNDEIGLNELHEIIVYIDDKLNVNQYISNRIWCAYRGTSVSPDLLMSIHMALEKFFLDFAEKEAPEILESWLIYLLKNSKSASISAVVTSIVLAFPDKTFNVAKILSKTKEFFFCDLERCVLDQSHKHELQMLKDNFSFNGKNDFYENERISSCDLNHRKSSLEHLFLKYQIFRTENLSEEEFQIRQKILRDILDNYYNEIPEKSKQNDNDKTWRMFLSRMDFRKMTPIINKTNETTEISFNPKIDEELKKESEDIINANSLPIQYSDLKIWAFNKLENKNDDIKYKLYEENPLIALEKVKEIYSKLEQINIIEIGMYNHSDQEKYYLFNNSIPGVVSAVLIRDYFDILSEKDNIFCKDIILEYSSKPLLGNYQYQISDGARYCIGVLNILLEKFPKDKDNIKMILLFILFDEHPIGTGIGKFNDFAIGTILKLWKDNFLEAQSLLFGYLILKPKFDKLMKKVYEENIKKRIYQTNKYEVLERLIKENEDIGEKILKNEINIEDIKNIDKISLEGLRTSFQLLPLKTDNEVHRVLAEKIVNIFSSYLTSYKREDKVEYNTRIQFIQKFTYFVLSGKQENIEYYLKPFLDKFNNSEVFAELFENFILAEDYLGEYDNFWIVWELFKDKLIKLCEKGENNGYTNKIIKSYLFSETLWNTSSKSWHSLKDKEKIFLKDFGEKTGHCKSVLFSISKLLDNIGDIYLNDGLKWISEILSKNAKIYKDIKNIDSESDIVYYLEKYVRKYVYKNHEIIKKNKNTKKEILVILDYLIFQGSVIGYIIRERIL